jgi:hypothetical protein
VTRVRARVRYGDVPETKVGADIVDKPKIVEFRVRMLKEDDRLIRPESGLAKSQGECEEYAGYSRRG